MKTGYVKSIWAIDQVLNDCKISKKAGTLIANIKAVLTTEELRYDFMMRVSLDPTELEINRLLYDIRKEQLELNPMSVESFIDMYLLNPVKALTLYFKENIVPYQVERMKQWGININDLITAKQYDSNIRFERAVMQMV
ncbi:hypothetical protein IFU39_13720 [Paenibacillus sp. CFBP 13594]|uniref:hypothetical protein n=1 Tax=Paenibacillus sp. CFBP 13594 TaxID=2774037 RepID=UPI0017875703|nr:hypothetical protein [Paenibacillus sp. CFBP 13594]MBD8838874.1 hypothetical protein [Paenibacillus sp. CFBP 13594]